jgi:hypothetical protein
MSACHPIRILRCSWIALIVVSFFAARAAHAQMLDLNGNGTSDLWELLYGAENFAMDFDSDGDGVPNRLEATAGTDPRDARSVPKISGYRLATNGLQKTFQVAIQAVAGKRYELQSSETVDPSAAGNWTSEGSLVARANATVTISAAADRPAKFFRLSVSDVDTDGDGLNDWEEYQLGLDPLDPFSNAQSDGYGARLNDYRYVTNRLASQSLASLMAATLAARPRNAGPVCAVAASGGFPIAASPTPTGTGLTGNYYTNASTTYTNAINFNPTNLFLTTNDTVIDFTWGPAITPNLSNGNYTVRWTGQVEPQYSETYFFETRTDDGVKLWVNDQLLIDHWQNQNATWTNAITLVADVRYNIRLEYYNRVGSARARLSWFSPSQPRQVIPSTRLYPSDGGYAPGGVTSLLNAYGFLGQPFTYTITGANSPLSFGVSNVPPGLSFNSTNGVISGVPSLAGIYDVSIAVTNAAGVSEAVLHLEVFDTGSSVAREVWLNASGSKVADIPLYLPASQTNNLGNLEGITNFGDNYGERVRGYLIAPATGHYYFWIAGNSAAELWVSNDKEPANGRSSPISNQPGWHSKPASAITSKSCTRLAAVRTITGRSAGCSTRPAQTQFPQAWFPGTSSRLTWRRHRQRFRARCIPRTWWHSPGRSVPASVPRRYG